MFYPFLCQSARRSASTCRASRRWITCSSNTPAPTTSTTRGNLSKRWHQGKESRYTWDLFDRLTHFEDERLQADYSYDALGRRLTKYSKAHYEERREAGPHWNRAERVKRNRELQCGFTLYEWDGDTMAWESKIADEDGFGARTTHYVYEPGSFVPVAQAVRDDAILLHDQPEYGDYYRRDEDPLWLPPPPAPAINSLAWYQCDHLCTPQELTDEHSEIAWGAVKEVIRKASDGRVELRNPIRFQGQYHDHETELHYNRYRYYDPEVGRFVSKDPMRLAAGINPHAYAPNPVRWADPLGLDYGIGIDPAAAGGNGHATLYFLNERGAWFAFNQGAAGETSSGGNIGFLTGSNAPAGVSIEAIAMPPDGTLMYKTTTDQDRAIAMCANGSMDAHNSGERKYNLYRNNCKDSVVDVLGCAGINVPNPTFTFRPNSWIKLLYPKK
ncbi:hypothetical protein FOZ70_22665 [Burkholderia sp. COPS]|nr:hypothetical protein [Burkholderia sp. COPS]